MKKRDEIVVLGAAESGTGAAVLAKKKGFKIFVSDKGAIKTKYKSVLKHFEIDFEEGGHDLHRILSAKEVIKSPGIPDSIPLMESIRKKNIPVISEIEFASRFTSAKMICVTGSNGKTTTTLLLGHILKTAGIKVGIAGNVGKSFAWQVVNDDKEVYVLELSSFQLDGMYEFKADISILLNITPDHLDRYKNNFENYINSKFKILQNQSKNDAFIYCYDDPTITTELAKRKVEVNHFPFSLKVLNIENGAYVSDRKLIIKHNKKDFNMTLSTPRHTIALTFSLTSDLMKLYSFPLSIPPAIQMIGFSILSKAYHVEFMFVAFESLIKLIPCTLPAYSRRWAIF